MKNKVDPKTVYPSVDNNKTHLSTYRQSEQNNYNEYSLEYAFGQDKNKLEILFGVFQAIFEGYNTQDEHGKWYNIMLPLFCDTSTAIEIL